MADVIKGRIRSIEGDLPSNINTFLEMEMLTDIIRLATRLSRDHKDTSYNARKLECQILLLQAYNRMYANNSGETIAYLKNNELIRNEINEAFNIVPNAMTLVAVPASNAFREAFRSILRPGGPFPPLPVPFSIGLTGPGATDDRLRQNIINMFGSGGENILRFLTPANMVIYAPGMFARYQAMYGSSYPVSVIEFGNNIMDYLVHKGGKKHSVTKKRKSMSKRRKNSRKSNKQRRR